MWIWVAVSATVAAGLLIWFGHSKGTPTITARPEEPSATEHLEAAGPYRVSWRRQLPPSAPRVSAVWTVIALLASLVVSALALPRLVSLPRWIEAELVVLCWWMVWSVVLSTLLYRGFRLKDDWVYFAPWDRSTKERTKLSVGDGCDPGCVGDIEGLLVVVVLTVLLGAAWAFVELVLPFAFLLTYTLVLRALRRVAHDRHGCEARLGPAIGWGMLWAAIYVAPLGGVIILLELMAGTRTM
jgi:hypothetical protein